MISVFFRSSVLPFCVAKIASLNLVCSLHMSCHISTRTQLLLCRLDAI